MIFWGVVIVVLIVVDALLFYNIRHTLLLLALIAIATIALVWLAWLVLTRLAKIIYALKMLLVGILRIWERIPTFWAQRKAAGKEEDQKEATQRKNPVACFKFSKAHRLERNSICTRRKKAGYRGSDKQPLPQNLVGLALSGGGIRSATFCLGLLQGMNRYKLLPCFDYLSTVSGGGFIGGWWSAWLSRKPEASVQSAAAFIRVLPETQLQVDTKGKRLVALAPLSDADERVLLDQLPNDPLAADRIHKMCHQSRQIFPDAEALEPERPIERLDHGTSQFEATDPVHHVRLYSNYLTPRKGALSLDTWRAITIISRNLVFTWLVLIPIILAALVVGRSYFVLEGFLPGVSFATASEPRTLPRHGSATQPAATTQASATTNSTIPTTAPVTTNPSGSCQQCSQWVRTCESSKHSSQITPAIDEQALKDRFRFALWPILFLVLLSAYLSLYWLWTVIALPGNLRSRTLAWELMFLACLTGGFLVFVLGVGPPDSKVASIVGILLLVASCIALTVYTHWPFNFLDPRLKQSDGAEHLRNRIIRAHSTLLIVLVVLTVVLLISGFGHEVVKEAISLGEAKVKAVGWTAILGAIFGSIYTAIRNAPTGGGDQRSATIFGLPSRLAFAITPPLVLIVLLLGGSYLVDRLLEDAFGQTGDKLVSAFHNFAKATLAATLIFAALAQYFRRNTRAALLTHLLRTAALLSIVLALLVFFVTPQSKAGTVLLVHGCMLVVLLSIVAAIGLATDPNALSLHTFYKARLTRAYIGASNPQRIHEKPSKNNTYTPITSALDGDDLLLKDLINWERGAPYPLINTTLNLYGGRDLATQQRLSAPFVLSPKACGSARTSYFPTERYMDGKFTLGTAVAVSGAAVAPNSGACAQSAALAMLLTLFNIRLGFWAANPGANQATDVKPQLWPYYTLREFLSQTSALSCFCFLTDGGHFDNTSLYSLVERGCRHIVLADCGADPEACFQDLGDAIRRCRIDFNADIRININPLRHTKVDRFAKSHFVVGKIQYDQRHIKSLSGKDVEERDRIGTLVLVKPTLTPGVPADVRQYAIENESFPQQTTADQWYGEAQFESYRALGEFTAGEVFDGLRSVEDLEDGQPPSLGLVSQLFAEIEARAGKIPQ